MKQKPKRRNRWRRYEAKKKGPDRPGIDPGCL